MNSTSTMKFTFFAALACFFIGVIVPACSKKPSISSADERVKSLEAENARLRATPSQVARDPNLVSEKTEIFPGKYVCRHINMTSQMGALPGSILDLDKDGSLSLEGLAGTWKNDRNTIKLTAVVRGSNMAWKGTSESGLLLMADGSQWRKIPVEKLVRRTPLGDELIDWKAVVTGILNGARLLDGAIEQFAIDQNAPKNTLVEPSKIKIFMGPANEFYDAPDRNHYLDLLGNPYIISTVGAGVKINGKTKEAFADRLTPSFWQTY